VADWLK